MFNFGNLADLGAHAEQLKALVTGLLNATQESAANSKASADNSARVLDAVQLMHGAISNLGDRVASLESQMQMVYAHTHSSDEIIPRENLITKSDAENMTAEEREALVSHVITGSGESSQRPDDSV